MFLQTTIIYSRAYRLFGVGVELPNEHLVLKVAVPERAASNPVFRDSPLTALRPSLERLVAKRTPRA